MSPAARKRKLMSDLVIDEVAFCAEGMNPEAQIVLYKARKKPKIDPCEDARFRARRRRGRRSRTRQSVDAVLEKLTKLGPAPSGDELDELHDQLREALEVAKQDGDDAEPPSFEEVFLDQRLMEIDAALDRRAHALIRTTTEIMRSEVTEKEPLVLEAVAAYAAAMNRDVPELFAGRLAKWIQEITADGPPDTETCFALVKAELETAGLPLAKEKTMEFLAKLTKRGKDALAFVLKGRKVDEVFAGLEHEDGQTILAGLLDKAGEWADRIDTLEKSLEAKAGELLALRKATDQPPDLETMLKSVTDPDVRAHLEAQAAAITSQGGELRKLREQRVDDQIEKILKAVPSLPAEGLKAALVKAHAVGILEPIEKTLLGAEEMAKLGKLYKELDGQPGIELGGADGAGMTPEEADAALVQKAAELRKMKPELTAEGAYTQACEDNSGLYLAASASPRQ